MWTTRIVSELACVNFIESIRDLSERKKAKRIEARLNPFGETLK